MGISVPRLRGGQLTAVILAIASALSGLAVWTVLEARRDDWARASQAARDLNRAVSEELARTVERLNLSLRAVVNTSRAPGGDSSALDRRQLVLFNRAATAGQIGPVLVLDESGAVIIASQRSGVQPGSRADREYFAFHRDHPDGGSHVSRPYPGGTAQEEWLIGVSRRLARSDGGFAGVVVGEVRLASVRTPFAGMNLGPGDSLTLLRKDGAVLTRIPSSEVVLGGDDTGGDAYGRAVQARTSGRSVAEAALDGVSRLYTTGRVEGAPLLVNVSLLVAGVDAGWRHHAPTIRLVTLVLVAMLAGGGLLLRRELLRRQASELTARESAAGFRLLAENCSDMVSGLGSDGVRHYVSPASWRLLGRAPEAMVGRRPQEDVHPDDAAAVTAAGDRLRSGEAEEAAVTYRTQRADGAWIWLESTLRTVLDPDTGRPEGVVAVSRDVTERKEMEAELARLAAYDGLTGIANRRGFDAALGREWLRCARIGMPVSVLLIDVDHFKALNDHYGHQRGDECLRLVGAVVGAAVRRAGDLAARYGGEEFAVLLPETDADGAAATAERVRAGVEALGLPHAGRGPAAVVTASVGHATAWPTPGEASPGPAALVETADQGLYEAKGAGRNRVAYRPAAPRGAAEATALTDR